EDFIAETDNVLNASTAGHKIFATYLVDAHNKVYQYDLDGNKEREIELPTLGTASGFSGRMQDSILYYSFVSYIYPSTIFKYDIESGNSEVYKKSGVQFNPEDYTTEQVFYKSKDGTEVPMFITYKKGLKKDGQNPTILYGYGGFNISLTPSFSTSNI